MLLHHHHFNAFLFRHGVDAIGMSVAQEDVKWEKKYISFAFFAPLRANLIHHRLLLHHHHFNTFLFHHGVDAIGMSVAQEDTKWEKKYISFAFFAPLRANLIHHRLLLHHHHFNAFLFRHGVDAIGMSVAQEDVK